MSWDDICLFFVNLWQGASHQHPEMMLNSFISQEIKTLKALFMFIPLETNDQLLLHSLGEPFSVSHHNFQCTLMVVFRILGMSEYKQYLQMISIVCVNKALKSVSHWLHETCWYFKQPAALPCPCSLRLAEPVTQGVLKLCFSTSKSPSFRIKRDPRGCL